VGYAAPKKNSSDTWRQERKKVGLVARKQTSPIARKREGGGELEEKGNSLYGLEGMPSWADPEGSGGKYSKFAPGRGEIVLAEVSMKVVWLSCPGGRICGDFRGSRNNKGMKKASREGLNRLRARMVRRLRAFFAGNLSGYINNKRRDLFAKWTGWESGELVRNSPLLKAAAIWGAATEEKSKVRPPHYFGLVAKSQV